MLTEDVAPAPIGPYGGEQSVGDWLHLPLSTRRMQKLTKNYVSSNAKIKAALGVEKMPVDARSGLRETVRSFEL